MPEQNIQIWTYTLFPEAKAICDLGILYDMNPLSIQDFQIEFCARNYAKEIVEA